MEISKAVITAAGSGQRTLPLQTLIDRDGVEKSVLRIIVEEVLRAGIEEICIVVKPGDEIAYAESAEIYARRLRFVHQDEQLGYGHAVFCAREFVGLDPFLHLVGDHLYISRTDIGCAQHLVSVASTEDSAISAVQATRETLLPYYGVIGGSRLTGRSNLYQVENVKEKPTPSEAEQYLMMPGLRAGHYLCFFGMHVLTPVIMDILERLVSEAKPNQPLTLTEALAELPRYERYLALKKSDWRYDIGVRYGLMIAQVALALSGKDRDDVLTRLLELLALREEGSSKK